MFNKESMLSPKELVLAVERVFINSGFTVKSFDYMENGFIEFNLLKNESFIISVNVRNIGSAYLPNKPYILRRQVGKMIFESIPDNGRTKLSMLLGVGNKNNRLLLACWNPFYFIGHSTNRSCYVLESSLDEAYEKGFYDGVDCKTPVLVCSENNFEKLLHIYIERNAVE